MIKYNTFCLIKKDLYESPFLKSLKSQKRLNKTKTFQIIEKRILFDKPYFNHFLTFKELCEKLHIFNGYQYGEFITKMKYLSNQYGETSTIIISFSGNKSDFKLPENEPKYILYKIYNNDGKLNFYGGAQFTYDRILFFTM